MSASAKYGSDNVSLWTPVATGSSPFSHQNLIAAWIDGEDSTHMTLTTDDAGNSVIVNVLDQVRTIRYGAPAGYSSPRFSNGTDSLLVNNRNTLHFWESSLQNTPDTALTASLDAFDGILPEGNDNHHAFMVWKPNGYFGGANHLYQWGSGYTNGGRGLALWVTGSGDRTDDHYYFLSTYGGGEEYRHEDTNSRVYASTGKGNFVFQRHDGGDGILSKKFLENNSGDLGIYSGETLSTNNFNRDMEFWIGEEIGGAGRGIDFQLCELIIMTGSINDADRQLVEGYLAHKWGLVADLPSNHPYRSSAPTNGISPAADPFPNKQVKVNGKRYAKNFVDDEMSNLCYQYTRADKLDKFVPLRLKVRGPSNLRSRATVYKVTKE